MEKKPQLFLVEDDLSFGAVLKSYLELNDYSVTWIEDGKHAVDRFRNGAFELCILDVMLPHVDGFTIGAQIRKMNDKIPLIFLTAKTMKEDILKGYNLGADDYITKPFDTEVLLCKIKAVLKRGNGNSATEKKLFELGSYHFDVTLRQISREGQIQKLSPKEAELLRMLCERQNDLLPRETALNHIWGDDGYFTARSMDVFVSRLRKYFADDPSIEIKNIHGSGFLLEIKS